jgi:hypothetical protein
MQIMLRPPQYRRKVRPLTQTILLPPCAWGAGIMLWGILAES